MFPREQITAAFDALADRILGVQKPEGNARAGFRFGSRALARAEGVSPLT